MYKQQHNIPLAGWLLFAFLLSACSKQLEITPETFVSPEELYRDEAGAVAGVTGIYRIAHEWKKSDYYFMGILGTDEGKTSSFVPTWGGYWQHFSGVNSYNNLFGAQNDLVRGLWTTLYKGINNANTAIRYIPSARAGDQIKSRLMGEALFMRGMFYFTLVQFFGAVPMPTDATNPSKEESGLPKSSVEEVYALVISDLEKAVQQLSTKANTPVGRANKEAAMALLGKVLLTNGKFELAEKALQPLVTSTAVGLLDDYADLFDEENENNKESLFEFQYSNEEGNYNGLANALGGWHINNTKPGGGGHAVIPTDRYSNSFESNADERKLASIRYEFFDASSNPVDYSWWADVGKPHVKKFDITEGVSRNGSESSRNLYYLRFADALLMYAEVLNEMNSTATAITYLNKVRNRAGLPNIETAWGRVPTKDELKNELLLERMRELGFEGWRWFDLKRTGHLVDYTKAYNPDAAPFITDRNKLYPISSEEFELNQSLLPSDQNPGY